MKIQMNTTKCGPDPKENWHEGQKRDVCEEEARYWHKAGVCTLLEPYPSEAEKAVAAPAEKAVVGPKETAGKGKVEGETLKPPVAPPAASDEEKQAAAPAPWGQK